jgi:hypothetical protein
MAIDAGAAALGLVSQMPEGAHAGLRAALPGVKLVQVIHVTGPDLVPRPKHVREAIETVGPFGLDVCSGLRSGEDFDLDPDKLERFMAPAAL